MTVAGSLNMLSFTPDMNRLMRLSTRERLLPPGGDLGYALHAIFAASFGKLAPKPFALIPPGTRGCKWRLLGYSLHPLEDLRVHVSAFADPDFLAPLDFDAAAEKSMPESFRPGACYGFRLRVRPTVRTGKPKTTGEAGGASGRAKELDAYQAAALTGGPDATINRGQVYADWLAARLSTAGAELEAASLESFRRTRLLSRDRSNAEKKTRWTEGPDALFTGKLRIADPMAFAAGLARGVGRYRSFGFGMLLLAPP
jgi:CRISPR system Cascade subunit CasE